MKKITFLIFFATQIGYAQSSIVSKTIDKIEFKQDTIKSVFDWIADNIKYDVNKLREIEKKSGRGNNKKFKTEEEFKESLLKEIVKRKKGVCQNYSLLFDAIMNQLGYESYIIEGYTKNKKGIVNRKLGHTWNVVKVNGSWKFYDTTWGAGYIKDGKRFVKSYNPIWYDVQASEMIKTHMPFDPMWQLLSNPISYDQFEKRTNTATSEGDYNFNVAIEAHKEKSEKTQLQDQLNRSREMGEGIRVIKKWRGILQNNLKKYRIDSQTDLVDDAKAKFENSVELFNDYISVKNERFKKKNRTIVIAKQNLIKAKDQIKSAIEIFNDIDIEDRKATKFFKKAIKNSNKLLERINHELEYIEKFTSK